MGSVCCSDERDRACEPAGDDDYASEYYEYIARPPWPAACKPFRPSTPPLGRSASDLSVHSYEGATTTIIAAAPAAAPATAPRNLPAGAALRARAAARGRPSAAPGTVAPDDMHVQL
jgi:hypothetical protein